MKREILFRAKKLDLVTSKPTSEWVYGYLMRGANDGEFMIQEKSKRCHLVDGNTIGEYTGLVDKNGTKIFEGDIVKTGSIYLDYNELFVVEFGKADSDYNWGWQLRPIPKRSGLRSDIFYWSTTRNTDAICEVIGNVIDNPRLLEQKE